ncbi:envelope stress response membrane protein PspC [Sphingomicrobium lutaoense]|uniref:Phage shock protein C n=1 Tax=Sphingomicrobium lutaoense TaxID=515949 RepID=A0A839Z0T2_9SPHN|nr:envelope stress response membrane protein PspC [Sphingomicrobium lutaoense]MBB3763657.1 phage shock protein C [Sphingomicrobium lutaoense]
MPQPPSRTKFYKDKRNGKVMGVCAGIADYTGFDVTLVRIMFLMTVFMSGGSTVPLYFIAGWIADNRPEGISSSDEEERRFWQGVRASPRKSARQIHSQFRDIDRRLADIESFVTSENRVLAQQIDDLR